MMFSVRDFILKHRLLNNLYRLAVSTATRRSIAESNRRKSLDLFDYLSLAKPMEKNHQFHAKENNLYGNGRLLRHIKGLKESNSVLEHGFILGGYVSAAKAESWTKCLVTFSDYRKAFLEQKTHKNVVCVGPYIHYFPSLLNRADLDKLKKQLGKVLLVFPSHSLNDVNIKYNKKAFMDQINEIAKDYDTVLICLYWADVLKGEYKEYTGDKFKIVTAGHIYDTYFLNRLRTIFELSDYVFSNSAGTHVGYAVYLKKPLYLLKQNIEIEVTDSNSKGLGQRNNEDHRSKDILIEQLYALFNTKDQKEITQAQYDFISELFGFKYVQGQADINEGDSKWI